MASTQFPSFRAAPVQSVQELIKEPIPAVPQPFILDDPQSPILSASTPLPLLPTINMKHLIMSETADSELEKLHSTCKEWGFFQLVNHGVSSSLVEKLKSEIGEFYKLPLEERIKYKMRPGDFEGYGLSPIRSEDQKLDWGDRFYMTTNPIHTRKPYLLPELPPSLRDSLECYLAELQKLAMILLGFMAKALKLEKGEMEELFEDGMQSVRMTYYPPCPQPELVMGLTPHSDATGITILLQINGVDGLQIKKDGVWIPVSFLPDALVVNIGDILEILSNGVYTSIEHRATVNAAKERISIAMFFNPRDSLECYLAELQKLAMMLLGFMAKALKLEKGEMEELFEDGMQSVRMTYYPPCPQPELVMGLTPHSDATGITILLQINAVDGLQIKKDGIWIPVSFLPDAFVVNVGDILEILSNGVYTSIEHRATVNASKERISIAMFFNPKSSLHSTCKEWGFFQLVNHGVSSSLVEKLKSEIGGFYKLPLEERMKYKMRPGDVEGYGHLPIRSEDQKLDWGDRFYMTTNPIHTRKPYLLPELPSSLRDSLERYLAELQKLAMMLLGFMAKALKLEKREMEELFEDGMQSVRMTYYPPCPQPELVMGLTPHSDASGITILLQINGVDGLQIKKDGVWIPVSFLPDALVVNVGDVLEILSNGV
ncbi:uncharacterized protein LOC117923131 [Vitis riparia]|uniref:uncharacterized protein LOC117923131 n=1 Tax=Vitis riparia TaxID=96939 RepID=UPI00155B17DF|nr:uncharacterized protein LOC117923131 [Vitis riparia]